MPLQLQVSQRARAERVVAARAEAMLVPPVATGPAEQKGLAAGRGQRGYRPGHRRAARRGRSGAGDELRRETAGLHAVVSQAQAQTLPKAIGQAPAIAGGRLVPYLSVELGLTPGHRPGQDVHDPAHGVASVKRGEASAYHFDAFHLFNRERRPVHLAGIGIVDRLAVDEHQDARLQRTAPAEAPHPDASVGVLKAFAAKGIEAGGGVERLVEHLYAPHGNLLARNGGNRYRRLISG